MKSKAVKSVSEAELAGAYKGLGHTEAAAKIAARGRVPVRESGSIVEAARGLGLSQSAARTFARGRSGIREAVKNVAGLPAECFAWVPDPADPTTWKMQISRSANTGTEWSPDEDLVRAAAAQLPGVATYGKALDIPDSEIGDVKARLRAAWIAANLPLDDPAYAVLQQEALRREFMKLGLSESAAGVAARGRERRRR